MIYEGLTPSEAVGAWPAGHTPQTHVCPNMQANAHVLPDSGFSFLAELLVTNNQCTVDLSLWAAALSDRAAPPAQSTHPAHRAWVALPLGSPTGGGLIAAGWGAQPTPAGVVPLTLHNVPIPSPRQGVRGERPSRRRVGPATAEGGTSWGLRTFGMDGDMRTGQRRPEPRSPHVTPAVALA